jgi:fibronectin type 3 domain-containing protein
VTGVNGYSSGDPEGNVGFFNGSHPVNGSITWPYVGAPTNGNYQIHVWYANGSSNTLAMPMSVNGTYVGTVQFPPTGSWTSYVNGNGLYANLTSSNNTVSLSVLSPGLGTPVIQALYVPTATPSTPAAPTGLTAVPNTNAPQSSMMTWITLNWNPVSQASCYNIYRNGLPIAKNVTATTFTDTHVLGAGTSENYAVTAYNQSGEGASTNVSAVSRQATPSYCNAAAGANQVVVSVPSTPGATSYTFSRSTTNGGPYTALVTTTNTSYTDTAVTDGTTYYYVATASNATSKSFPTAQSSAVPYVPYSGSPVLIDVDLGTGATQSGAAVLGTNGDHWNAVSATTSTIVNSAGTTLSGVGLSLSDNGVYTDTGGIAMDTNTTALMEDYAYGNGTTVTVNLTGLTNYRGANVTLVVYAAGDDSGQGATLTLSGGTGGNSGSALSTTATSRQVSAGNGVAYQTYTGTLNNGTLTITATELSGQSFTVVNGLQLYLTHP